MQKQTIITYSFDELPIETQQEIAESWRNDDWFPWSHDWRASLDRFAEYFGLQINDFGKLEFKDDNYYKFHFGENNLATSEISGIRLYKMLLNRYFFFEVIENKDCPFTGYCADESLLKPIRDFIKQPCKHTSFGDLVGECFDNWLKNCTADIEHWESFDGIKEEILANDYQFTADGDLF